MEEEDIRELRIETENKIAVLCNELCEVSGGHIADINVDYGACNKGWFPDNVINISINLQFVQVYPVAYADLLEYKLKKKRKAWLTGGT